MSTATSQIQRVIPRALMGSPLAALISNGFKNGMIPSLAMAWNLKQIFNYLYKEMFEI